MRNRTTAKEVPNEVAAAYTQNPLPPSGLTRGAESPERIKTMPQVLAIPKLTDEAGVPRHNRAVGLTAACKALVESIESQLDSIHPNLVPRKLVTHLGWIEKHLDQVSHQVYAVKGE